MPLNSATHIRDQVRNRSAKPIRVDTAGIDPAFDLTTIATGGTVNTVATSANSVKITLNGTAYRIPVFV